MTTQQHKNEVHLAGLLVKDPVVRYTPTGKAVANLTILTKHEQYSEFHKVVCWEKTAEKVAELKKGAFLRIAGRLQTRSWDDKQTGQKKYVTEVVSFTVALGEEEPVKAATVPNGKTVAEAILSPASTKNIHGVEITDGDLPF